MKHVVLAGLLISALGFSAVSAFAQEGSNATVLGSVTLTRKVLADGQPLAPGTYQVRLSSEQVKRSWACRPRANATSSSFALVKVVGREVATVISNSDMATIASTEGHPSTARRLKR